MVSLLVMIQIAMIRKKKNKVLYAAWPGDRSGSGYSAAHAKNFGFVRYWIDRGYEIDYQVGKKPKGEWLRLIRNNNYTHAIIFNGNYGSMNDVRDLVYEYNIDATFFEGGFFINGCFVLDSKGYGPHSSLCDDSFDWLDKSHMKIYHRFKERYIRRLTPKTGDYIIAPLQVEHDPTLHKYSDCGGSTISTMREWIDFVDNTYAGHKIIYRPHPWHTKIFDRYKELQKYTKNTISEAKYTADVRDFMKACHGAYMCVGIHSHAMAQAMILGIPTYAHAKCPMARIKSGGQEDKEELDKFLAACFFNTVPFNDVTSATTWYSRVYPETV